MAHMPRVRCESETYHIVVRGVGRQILFEDDIDRAYFMGTLSGLCSQLQLDILAWCLMDNHVHLLLKGPMELLSYMMQKLESSYAIHFNKRHERVGTLFQDRFTSIPVINEEQLISVLQYIHLNPVKAGYPIQSKWSSYNEYLGVTERSYSSTDFLLDILGGVEEFYRIHQSESTYNLEPRVRLSNKEALNMARSVLGDVSLYDVRTFNKKKRDSLLVQLREAGLSANQIERFTSIGKNIIYRAK